MKKTKAQIIFIQETHLSKEEHEKLKKFGYRNTFYSTCRQSRKRGVAILIQNSVNFECLKETGDKEGRYIIVKGKLENEMVTLINVYAPPESDKLFFKTLFTDIASESEGMVMCAGDFNVILDTHYSSTHNTHSRIDYIFMNSWDLHKVKECKIGVADISDPNAVHLTVHLNNRRKNTTWRLNVGIMNNKVITEQIKMEIKRYIEENDTEETSPTTLWDALKAVIRGKLIAITSQQKKLKQAAFLNITKELKNLELQYQNTQNTQTLQEIKSKKGEIDDILRGEIEKKHRFVKQQYYEIGPKATRLLARRIRKQQALNTIHKIRDVHSNQIKHNDTEI